ncbi:probable LRR receptor-like serine/threonine-protein kinase At1g56140 [Humulus lupulus]|uniref:probable LRR receptor-like serine/threonine-protein kinase At1g56140 n=1 Tax=Humulus lupulus TaxID=3486 RepID=UPI002B414DB8|nr:probable LRR receptor-like serine/threonine-protein kinase At1g56140 [Humulus lupulus]
MDVRPFTFSYAELKTATNNFDSANKLGKGGFGPIYKGSLEDGRVIAVKQLSMTSHQGKSQFVAEIATIGYLAPEYDMRGHLTEKANMFAFGVVALETISGRPNSAPNLEEEQIFLLEWAWKLQEQNNEADLVDSELSEFDEDEVRRLIRVALLCTQTSPTSRPSMSRVVMLSGDIEVRTQISRPGYLADWSLDILSNILSDVATIGTNSTYYDSPASTSMVGDALPSLAKGATRPILQSNKSKGFGVLTFGRS